VTTPVRQYEGKGDSFFGVVDMAGNIWEWCLTEYNNKSNDINTSVDNRVLHGGCWYDTNSDFFRCDKRNSYDPYGGYNDDGGFRVSRS
jgi:formylglycine-generating enzyme required for sulfatase activity